MTSRSAPSSTTAIDDPPAAIASAAVIAKSYTSAPLAEVASVSGTMSASAASCVFFVASYVQPSAQLSAPKSVMALSTTSASLNGVAPAQVVIRWHLQTGNIVIPKSNNRDRMAQNFDVFGFELSAAEFAAIDALDENRRVGGNPAEIN